MTLMAAYFVVITMIVGGLGVDYLQLTAVRTKLQAASDNVAHAALLRRMTASREDALDEAEAIAALNLPADDHGEAILRDDIVFGRWDEDTHVFVADPDASGAVRVTARRAVDRNNIVSNLMLHMAGYMGFEIEVDTVFRIWEPGCFKNGFVARNVVDVQSNNAFGPQFCMHGNSHVEINNGNIFEVGAIVSMPDQSDLVLPNSGWEQNDGIDEALRDSFYLFSVLDELPRTLSGLLRGDAETLPQYVAGLGMVMLPTSRLTPADFEAGRLHGYSCNGSRSLSLDAGVYEAMVLATDCSVQFKQGVVLKDVIIATTNTGAASFKAPSGLQLGADDKCAPGGGAALLTMGGMSVASRLEVYGSQIIAMGDIDFAAQADGLEGVSMIAGGNIDTTSNVVMNGCPEEGMDLVLWERAPRMAR
ncbi:hypothetical protein GCM10011415_33100 [Salipiger pallidus]|uniref:Flp pilus-assembly TadE/G-like n=2 Tax=Salipiger pallidus TaxID=1775170 RepID=A0A8J2ZLX1_9RHOB|nr:hypothetical protein GCM10011415_33100 [Salipiger pallidus]